MNFLQRLPFQQTELNLLDNGVQVVRRSAAGAGSLAVELPYEELLPVRLDYEDATPWPRLKPALVLLGLASVQLLLRALSHARTVEQVLRREADASTPTMLLVLGGVWVAVLLTFGLLRRYSWQRWVLRTARLRLHLADVPKDRAAIQALAKALETHSKAYLRQEYADINPLGFIEPQLRRLRWLLELDVLTPAETRALTTRLTGRVAGEALRSMGQKLEPPFVN